MAFIILSYVPSIPTFWRVFFIIYEYWILLKAFSAYIDHMVFIFQFVNIVYHIDWFACIEESLHPWDKPHLIMVWDPFHVLSDSVY